MTAPSRLLDPAPPMPRLVERADIQGLRAVAVLLVILSHAGIPGAPGGYIGVDVFFVVSGYLISALLLREATETGRVSIGGFYSKRARRILPAATVVLVATTLAATIWLPFVRTAQIVEDVVWSTFFAANLHFARMGTDYFAAEVPPSPVQHFWSLSVEEQFYLVWPTLVAVVLVAAGSRGGGRVERARRRIRLLTVVVGVASVASLAWATVLIQTSPTAAYFSTPARVWELGAGVLLALSGRALPRIGHRVRGGLALGGVSAILFAAVTFDHSTAIPGPAALLPVLGTVAILAAGAGGRAPGVGRLLELRPLRWVGDLSYSLYLWHWPFLILGAAYAGRRLELWENLLLVGGAVVASVVTYHLVENPFRRAPVLRHKPRLALLLWPVAAGAVLISTTAATMHVDRVESDLADAGNRFSLADVPRTDRVARTGDSLHDEIALALDKATVGAAIPYPLQQPLRDLYHDMWDRDRRCTAEPEESTHDLCPVGDTTSKRTVVLLGDSHGNMWLPALSELGEEEGFEVLPFIKFGCTPAMVTMYRGDMGRAYDECSSWRDWALDEIDRLRPDAVVVGTHTTMRVVDERTGTRLSTPKSAEAWQGGMRGLAERLTKATRQVRLVGDLTYLDDSPAACLSAKRATMATCTADVSGRTLKMNRHMARAAKGTPARYVDITPLICADGRCPLVVGNTVVYRDRQH
ncbi:MAG: acyltransferase family protein, partial [Nocardioidaceae bacterium]